ncbi:MAG: hypothetical protein HKN35_15935 [Woeseia sp.]|nr:hypothetical protein [Woeseia sp.]
MNQQDRKGNIRERTVKYFDRKGRLELLSGVTAEQQLRWNAQQERKNREAEDAAVRKHFGEEAKPEEEGEDVGDNIVLGDVTETHNHPAPIQPPPPTPSPTAGLAKTLAALGLAAAGIGTGSAIPIMAWNWTRGADDTNDTAVIDDDADTRYRLEIFRPDEQEE